MAEGGEAPQPGVCDWRLHALADLSQECMRRTVELLAGAGAA